MISLLELTILSEKPTGQDTTYASLISLRVTNTGKSLPNSVALAPSLNSFKDRLDKFWKSQHCLRNYKDNLTGTTNRSNIEIQ